MSKLAILGGNKTIDNDEPHFKWPPITERSKDAVIQQLLTDISIYNRSGILAIFEDRFADYHDRKYALLNNSGTSAIYAMFEGINLQPGDEVICPTYTFYATASPLITMGVSPVFVDSSSGGNIDPSKIEKRITNNTKAVIITHMWGLPCDMDSIVKICDKYGLKLLEDCSHAHGAEYKNTKVGTFGDAAAWSLQGQKTVTGGEGGILLTDNEDIYSRAQLLGHYNKRCKQEIPPNHPLYEFATTGFGQKFRAHPLAIALANEQFDHLDEWIQVRNFFASKIKKALSGIDFLEMPEIDSKLPSWYAFVFRYRSEFAQGIPRHTFYECLKAEGLAEIDIPGSTRPIHDFPLFKKPYIVKPHFYKAHDLDFGPFPEAEAFFTSVLKMPVWSHDTDRDNQLVSQYIEGIQKVAERLPKDANQLLKLNP